MPCTNPKEVFNGFDVPMQVPCGKCRACRLARVKSWTFRLTAELPYWDSACFATFTYDDDHYFALETDYSLQHRDVQLFFKRLRKSIDFPIKYLMCGEYGGSTYRAHYHAIIFGYWPADAVRNPFTDDYSSASLTSLWSCGDVRFGFVTPDSCAYVAGYVNKKLGTTSTGVYDGVTVPYLACSRGIGLQYCLDNADQLRKQMCVYMPDGTPLPLPKYYKVKLGLSTEEKYEHYLKVIDDLYPPERYRNKELLRTKLLGYLDQKARDLNILERRTGDRNLS